ncbi:PDR/VanB family oxidoreductase [Micromonospora sp. DT31]|uniref:PDR/VanB family oxidoreductase n=1 Tax=Micromonospora sp. DT31 TaxID=3393434 RepID=UPI003CF528FF
MSNRTLREWRTARVVDSVPVTPTVRRVDLAVPAVTAPAPGSHLDVVIPLPEGEVIRSYSVVDDGRRPETVSVGVRLDPHSRGGSAFMHRLQAGDELIVSQPVQTFELTWGRPGYVLLAGGIGITPLVGMAQRLRHWGANYQLIYSARSREEMAFAHELQQDHPGRVRLTSDDIDGRLDLDGLVAGLPVDHELYVCGPMPMLHAARQAWAATGRPPGRLRFETFGSSGTAPAAPFVVRVPDAGVEAHVPADRTALDVLAEAGIEVMSDCLRGECGLCLVDVLDTEGPLDHRDVFLSDRQRATNTQMCLCVSRSAGGVVTLHVP